MSLVERMGELGVREVREMPGGLERLGLVRFEDARHDHGPEVFAVAITLAYTLGMGKPWTACTAGSTHRINAERWARWPLVHPESVLELERTTPVVLKTVTVQTPEIAEALARASSAREEALASLSPTARAMVERVERMAEAEALGLT